MAFTRQSFDPKAYKQDLYESTEVGRYKLAPYSSYRQGDTCFQETPEIRPRERAVYRNFDPNSDLVNVESDLYNLPRKNSHDPLTKYPFTQKKYNRVPTLGQCNSTDLSRRYPLLEAPAFKREQSIHVPRFESLCLNPQQLNRIRSNGVIGLQSRLWHRDNYVPKIPAPKGDHAQPNYPNTVKDPSTLQKGLKSTDFSTAGNIKCDYSDFGKINCAMPM